MKYKMKMGMTLVGLLCCLLTFASSALPYQSGRNTFFMQFNGAFLGQNGDGTQYTILDSNNVVSTPNGEVQRLNPSYRWSGGGSLGVLFKSNTDIAFSFFFNEHHKYGSVKPGNGQHADALLAPAFWTFSDAALDSASGRFDYKTNEYNLVLGHWFSPSLNWSLHPYWGIHVADIKLVQYTEYVSLSSARNFNAQILETSSVLGLGPLGGMEALYHLYGGLSLMGNFKMGIMTGHIRSAYKANITPSSPVQEAYITSKTRRSLFELIHSQMGFLYRFPLHQDFSGNLVLGFQLTEYLGSNFNHSLPDDFQNSISSHFFEDSGSIGPFLSLRFNWS